MKKPYVLTGLFVMLVIFTSSTAAQNVVTTTLTFQAPSDAVFDICTQEYVKYKGSVQMVTYTWFDANGAQHIRGMLSQINVSGTGQTTQLDYQVLAGTDMVEMITTTNAPFVETFAFRQNLNGAGPAPNEQMTTLYKITVNADGSTAAEVDTNSNPRFDPKCSGK